MDRLAWKAGLLAERLRSLSGLAAMEAAARSSRPDAVVAEECLRLAEELSKAVEERLWSGRDEASFRASLAETAEQAALLALNAALVALKDEGSGMAICAEEIRRLAADAAAGLDGGVPRPAGDLRAADPLRSGEREEFFIAFDFGGARVVENVAFVIEAARFAPLAACARGGRIEIRGRSLPLLEPGASARGLPAPGGAEPACVLVLEPGWSGESGRIAVMTGWLGAASIFPSRLGRPLDGAGAGGLPAAFVREAWKGRDGGEALFLDWPLMLAASGGATG